MLQEIQNFLNLSLTLEQVLANMSIALVCGVFISYLYRWTYKGPGYSTSFVNAVVLLAMITAVVIMVIGNNLARAFGLVGAMSIIRFRTAIKDTQDIVFIFFALAVGMAAGVGLYKIAIAGSLFIGVVLFLLSKTQFGVPKGRKFLLQFSYISDESQDTPYVPILNKYCKQNKLINVKSDGTGEVFELSFYINLKNSDQNHQFVRDLSKVQGVSNVNLFFDEEQF